MRDDYLYDIFFKHKNQQRINKEKTVTYLKILCGSIKSSTEP